MNYERIYNESEAVRNFFEHDGKYYGAWGDKGHEIEVINPDDQTVIAGALYGDDECFDTGVFYQYLITEGGKILKCYYSIENEDGEQYEDLSDVDYEHPFRIKDVTEQFC